MKKEERRRGCRHKHRDKTPPQDRVLSKGKLKLPTKKMTGRKTQYQGKSVSRNLFQQKGMGGYVWQRLEKGKSNADTERQALLHIMVFCKRKLREAWQKTDLWGGGGWEVVLTNHHLPNRTQEAG